MMGDSIIVQIRSDSRQEPVLALHTSDVKTNFACWYTMIKYAGKWDAACIKKVNVIYFGIVQMVQQTINRNPRQPWVINKAVLKNETISYSRTLSANKVAIGKKPSFTDVSMFEFDEIFTVTFTLEPFVKHVKDIWMIQDPEEPSTSRRLGESEE